jgi:hypothetical protein
VRQKGRGQLRPLARWLGVRPGGYTPCLQRVVVDFGAEESFATAAERLELHHALRLSASTVRTITLHHARAMETRAEPVDRVRTLPPQGADCIIAQGVEHTGRVWAQTVARANRLEHSYWNQTVLPA